VHDLIDAVVAAAAVRLAQHSAYSLHHGHHGKSVLPSIAQARSFRDILHSARLPALFALPHLACVVHTSHRNGGSMGAFGLPSRPQSMTGIRTTHKNFVFAFLIFKNDNKKAANLTMYIYIYIYICSYFLVVRKNFSIFFFFFFFFLSDCFFLLL
jgi:hypothetical protein